MNILHQVLLRTADYFISFSQTPRISRRPGPAVPPLIAEHRNWGKCGFTIPAMPEQAWAAVDRFCTVQAASAIFQRCAVAKGYGENNRGTEMEWIRSYCGVS